VVAAGGERRATLVEFRAVSGDAVLAEGWRRGDRVELEVVDVVVELERDHPVHKPARGDAGSGGVPGVQRRQPTAGVRR
jgi:hypothetical protein